jgi:hypothetical protein
VNDRSQLVKGLVINITRLFHFAYVPDNILSDRALIIEIEQLCARVEGFTLLVQQHPT